MKIFYGIFLLVSFYNTTAQSQTSDILITEIFADPSPSHGLPEKEFLELYNAGNKTISLKGYVLLYSNTRTVFPDQQILPQEYLIVCKKGNETDFSKYGRVVALASFSLLNEGTLLVLQNEKAEDLFSVKYLSSWYLKDRDQGFSLEMIDKNYPCRGKENWTSSQSIQGGTPGQENAVNASRPDNQGPLVVSQSLNSAVFQIEFNEKLNIASSVLMNNYKIISGSIEVSGISTDRYNSEVVKIAIKRQLCENEVFKLLVSGIADCSGNVMEPVTLTAGNFSAPDSGKILLSEVLFNPRTGGFDFVELFNYSDKMINLKDWAFSNKDSKGELGAYLSISDRDLILAPGAYIAFTENKEILRSQYPESMAESLAEVGDLPAFGIASGTVVLTDSSHRIFDLFSYQESMHHPMIDDPKGVSLERINFNVASSSIQNWKSSSSFNNFATPGFQNSQSDTILSNGNILYAEPEIFYPFSKGESDRTNLKFELSDPNALLTISVFNAHGRVVKILANNELSGRFGKVEWDGTDAAGNILPTGYYLFHVLISTSSGSETHLVKTVLGGY